MPFRLLRTAARRNTRYARIAIAAIGGVGEPFDRAKLAALYPGGKAEYLEKFTASLDCAIATGHILRDDRQEILDIANINFDATEPAAE